MIWDYVTDNDDETIVRYGERELWREPAFYEGYERYLEVVEMLSQKYGHRLLDLVPTQASELFLYGDMLAAPRIVEKCRARLRSSRNAV